MNISKRERTLLLVLLYIFVTYGGYKYVYEPINVKTAAAQSENVSLNAQLIDARRSNLQKVKSVHNVDKSMDEYQKLLTKVPEDRNFYEMIALLTSAADSSGTKLAGISYKNETVAKTAGDKPGDNEKTGQNAKGTTGPAETLTYTLKVTGRYFQLLEFLAELDTSPRIITVESSDISLDQKKQSAPPAVATQEGDEKGNASESDPHAAVTPEAPKRAAEGYDVNNATMTLQISTFYYPDSIK